MRILPCTNYNFKGFLPRKPGNSGIYTPQPDGRIVKNGKIFNRHTTTYFRSDLDWEELGKYLKNRFSDCDKVQTLIWGCSRGHEAYSLAILLKRYFGENYEKFLPIKAMDVDSRMIEKNSREKQDGFILDSAFIEKMQNGLEIHSLRYNLSEISKYCKIAGYAQYRLKNDIMNAVEFESSNVLNGLDKISPGVPAIIMFRNLWPYVDPDKYDEYVKKLYDKLPENSVVIIGEYDWRGDRDIEKSADFPKTMIKYGFQPSCDAGAQNSIFVFEKNKS